VYIIKISDKYPGLSRLWGWLWKRLTEGGAEGEAMDLLRDIIEEKELKVTKVKNRGRISCLCRL